jgi:hypothetical protein
MPPRPVWSKNFINAGSPSTSLTYNVPAGYVAKLHNMTLWLRDTNSLSLPINFFTVALDFAGAFVWTMSGPGARQGTYQWSGGEVFGGSLFMVTSSPPALAFWFRANGVLLTL